MRLEWTQPSTESPPPPPPPPPASLRSSLLLDRVNRAVMMQSAEMFARETEAGRKRTPTTATQLCNTPAPTERLMFPGIMRLFLQSSNSQPDVTVTSCHNHSWLTNIRQQLLSWIHLSPCRSFANNPQCLTRHVAHSKKKNLLGKHIAPQRY